MEDSTPSDSGDDALSVTFSMYHTHRSMCVRAKLSNLDRVDTEHLLEDVGEQDARRWGDTEGSSLVI